MSASESRSLSRYSRWIVAHPVWAALSQTVLVTVLIPLVVSVVVDRSLPTPDGTLLWWIPATFVISYLLLFLPISKHYDTAEAPGEHRSS